MSDKKWVSLFICWIIAAVATLGSLFFSEVMHFPPCILCWYQRICMYPLVILFLAGMFPYEQKVVRFTAPLAIVGWIIAFYHNLLYYKILPESAAPCKQGISCTSIHIEWLGFITIPFLSLLAFSLILFFLVTLHKAGSREK